MDPSRFQAGVRVTIQALGRWPRGVFQPQTADIASAACWYRREPHVPFPALSDLSERWSR